MTISAQAALASNELAERRGLGMVSIDRHTTLTATRGPVRIIGNVKGKQSSWSASSKPKLTRRI